ncbi:high affinity immunoglobulin epsilon receptor subunit beta [Pipistrellus kuhlii]|uniref:Membrane spanning 4-domains A2 n=1 Tax=Pipistrellus kuhlii TaxID=59472 RepID=A0A7J7X0I9_PIPKU|nr:high affinity immunoglobulin epsilon receptor subunit beta [Pipistrellus kuhlii]KAF6343197.1 membrane spanning 4-domains A2 [Pipistrellus kuhlii]
MDSENRSRADLALPNPQDSSSVPEIELSEAPFRDSTLPEKAAPPPRQTWLTFLKRELEFLGVTQILIGFICLYFGTIVYFVFKISEFEKEFFSSFKIGYPLWGAVIFAISGFLSIMSEKKNAAYLVQGSLGANLVSVIAAGTGIFILVTNLKGSLTYINVCQQAYEDDFCIAAFFSTELVAMILFLTILGFGAAVLLIAYRIGELLKENQIPEDRLYEELNIYSPIYSELEDRVETSPTDT